MKGKPLVFVSCGQVTPAERQLGKDLIALVESIPGLEAYFAETVTSLEGLSANIFRNLERASAFITVMHHRGVVKGRPGSADRLRASVWIEQEIAIASFLKHTRHFDLQVAAYAQRGLSREGVRDTLILNALEFDTEDQILADLRPRLAKWDLSPRRSEEPSLEVNLVRKDQDICSERHVYGLLMSLTNTSGVTISDIEYELVFPGAFVPPNRQFHPHEERRDQATETHRAFRGREKIDLRPGKSITVNILEYQVTHDLFWKYQDRMDTLPVTVEVYVSGKLAGSYTTPFKTLENF
jgi:hypothetical protein